MNEKIDVLREILLFRKGIYIKDKENAIKNGDLNTTYLSASIDTIDDILSDIENWDKSLILYNIITGDRNKEDCNNKTQYIRTVGNFKILIGKKNDGQ